MKYFFLFLLALFSGLSAEERKMIIHTELFGEEREEQGNWVSAGIERFVKYGIEQISSVRLSEYEDMKFAYGNVKRKIPRPERDRMIRNRTETDLILKGSVRLNGSDIIVYMEMTNAKNPEKKKSFLSAGSVHKISLLRLVLLEKIIQAANETAGAGFIPAAFTEKEKERFLQYPEFSDTGFFYYSRALSLRKTAPEESVLLFSQALSHDGSIPELLIDSAVMFSRKGEYLNDSENLLNRAADILKKNDEILTLNYIKIYYYLGVVFFNKGEFSTALEHFLKSKTMSEPLNLIHSVAYLEILNYLGDIHLKKGNLNNAVEYWLICKREYELKNMTDSIYYADLLNNTGVYYLERNSATGFEFLKMAREIYEKHRYRRKIGYANNLSNFGNYFLSQNNTDTAFYYYARSLKYYERSSNTLTSGYANALNNISSIHFRKKEYKESLVYLEKSKSVYEELNLTGTKTYAVILQNMGNLHLALKNPLTSYDYFRSAENVFEGLRLTDSLQYAQVMEKIGDMELERRGIKEAAYSYEKAYTAYLKSKNEKESVLMKKKYESLRKSLQ